VLETTGGWKYIRHAGGLAALFWVKLRHPRCYHRWWLGLCERSHFVVLHFKLMNYE
jgi:hypothetical protein